MLAALLLSANERVSLDRLTGELWDQPPDSAVANLRTYASGLRRLLIDLDGETTGGGRLVASAAGYQLRVDPDELDLHRFQTAIELGRTALARADHQTATVRFREALDLRRGRPAEDVRAGPELAARIALLEEQHLSLVEELIQARLALGEHAAVTGELRLLLAAHPYRERLRQHLMLALYRSGDVPAALSTYAETRAVFADQLGLEPGADLSRLHQAILRRAPELSLPENGSSSADPQRAPATGMPPSPTEPPRQLPPDPAAFVGRSDELRDIAHACVPTTRTGTGPAVVVLHGPGGVGKTALAVRAAHRLARHYPDGQLYLDLHGGVPDMPSVEPLAALGQLLRALGVPARDVPLQLAEATARLRSETAARRLLIVLDGADGAQQIRPLLPAGPHCAVLITSRRPTSTLDALRLRLDRLSEADARQLLDALTGDGRAAADPAAATRLVLLCDGYPLALRIAGARLAARPDWSVGVLADRLDNERERLDELRADDLAIRSSFWNSYRQLLDSADPDDRAAAAAFRALSLLRRVPEIPARLAAVTIGVPERRALTLLDRLADMHLMHAIGPTRFRFHDLLRVYGAELAEETDPAVDRHDAVCRGLAAYLTTVLRAGQLLRPHRASDLAIGPTVVELCTLDDAVRWVDGELAGILAAAGQACDAAPQLSRLCVEAIPSLAVWLQKHSRWVEADALVAICERAAAVIDDTAARAAVLALRATLHWRTGSPEAACGVLESALELWRRLGDREGEGRALQNLGWFHQRTGSPGRAADLVRAAVGLLADAKPVWLAMALHNLAEIEFELGNFPAANEHLTRCLTMRREHEDAVGEAMTLVALGRTHSQLGRHPDALAALTAGLRLCRRTGNREDEWEALLSRSEVHLRLGNAALAHQDAEEALTLTRATGERYGEAAALRQLGRVQDVQGERAAADRQARHAERIFADVSSRRDGVLERFLAGADHPAGVAASAAT